MHEVGVIVPGDERLAEPGSRADERGDSALVRLARLERYQIIWAQTLHAMSYGVEVIDDLGPRDTDALGQRADVDVPGEVRRAAFPINDRARNREAGAIQHVLDSSEKRLHDRR